MKDDVIFRTYYSNSINLAKTIMIKSDSAINVINEYVKLKIPDIEIDSTNKNEWKFYLNISGEYHTVDEKMYITSLDSEEDEGEILFNRSNLSTRPTTRSLYTLNSEYYKTLVKKYPSQSVLIYGIINPTDINYAIELANNNILNYDKRYIEDYEYSLIHYLNDWIYKYQTRWHNPAYVHLDPLYLAAQLTQVHISIVNEIMRIRGEHRHTTEVHSYYIKNKLGGFFSLDKDIDNLSRKEQLWLYRNIDFINKNLGTNRVLELINENIVAPTGIRIDTIEKIQTTEKRSDMLNEYTFVNRNLYTGVINRSDTLDLGGLLDMESDNIYTGGVFGKDYSTLDYDRIDDRVSLSNHNTVKSKVLKISSIIYGDISPIKYEDMLINNWIYLISKGIFNTTLLYNNPITNTVQYITQSDALHLFMYLSLYKHGVAHTTIPNWGLKYIPNYDIDVDVLIDGMIYNSKVDYLLYYIKTNPPTIPSNISSIDVFKEYINDLYNTHFAHWVNVSNIHDKNVSGMLYSIYNRLFKNAVVEMSTYGKTFDSWLDENNLKEFKYIDGDVDEMLTDLLFLSTGYKVSDVNDLKKVVNTVIGIINKVKAYSTQVVDSSNEVPSYILNRRALRVSETPITFINKPILEFDCMYEHAIVIDEDNVHDIPNFDILHNSNGIVLVYDTSLISGTTIHLRLINYVNLHIEWGDEYITSTSNIINTSTFEHTYNNNGVYTVRIFGNLHGFSCGISNSSRDSLIYCLSFGHGGIQNLDMTFDRCSNLLVVPSELPSTVTSTNGTFKRTKKFNHSNVAMWDMLNVVSVNEMFNMAEKFNRDLSNTVTGVVTQPTDFSTDAISWTNIGWRPLLSDGVTRINT